MLSLISAATGVFLACLGVLDLVRAREIAAYGVRTRGVVSGFYSKGGSRSAEVTFQPSKGAPVTFRTFIAGSLEKKDEVAVIFLSDRPKAARIESAVELWGPGGFLGGFGLALSLGSIFFFLRMRRSPPPG